MGTERQNKLARDLGIEDPEKYDVKALTALISLKLPPKPNYAQRGSKQATAPTTARHDVVLTRTEKPNSFEFGKVGNRHKLYYGDVAELNEMIKHLEQTGFVDDDFDKLPPIPAE